MLSFGQDFILTIFLILSVIYYVLAHSNRRYFWFFVFISYPLLSILIGLRPRDYNADTANYYSYYYLAANTHHYLDYVVQTRLEPGWDVIVFYCSKIISATEFFVLVSFATSLAGVYACRWTTREPFFFFAYFISTVYVGHGTIIRFQLGMVLAWLIFAGVVRKRRGLIAKAIATAPSLHYSAVTAVIYYPLNKLFSLNYKFGLVMAAALSIPFVYMFGKAYTLITGSLSHDVTSFGVRGVITVLPLSLLLSYRYSRRLLYKSDGILLGFLLMMLFVIMAWKYPFLNRLVVLFSFFPICFYAYLVESIRGTNALHLRFVLSSYFLLVYVSFYFYIYG